MTPLENILGDRVSEVPWPELSHLRTPAADLRDRLSFIGGSDANTILSGDRERIFRLWREKRGEIAAEDLSGSLPVMLGCWTEAFNRQWYERVSGERVMSIGKSITCRTYDWRRCTVDGLVKGSGAIWEAKHTSAFSKVQDVLERYAPQLQHNMAVAGCARAVLSVIFGNHKFEIIEVAADWLYQLDLLQAEEDFWDCVVTGREPVPAEVLAAPKPVATREVSLEGNNAWASAAFDWLQLREAAKIHAAATVQLKGLVEEDVTRAFGHGVEARRSKSGAITLKELPA